jgi:hypothetical protein
VSYTYTHTHTHTIGDMGGGGQSKCTSVHIRRPLFGYQHWGIYKMHKKCGKISLNFYAYVRF